MDKKGKIHRTMSFEIWRKSVSNAFHLETIVRKVRVSTIFFGVDSSFGMNKHPYLFETVIFKGQKSDNICRYTTIKDAKKGHAEIVKELSRGGGLLKKK